MRAIYPALAMILVSSPALAQGTRFRLDTFLSDPDPAQGRVVSVAPTYWWNDAGGHTAGLRVRSADSRGHRYSVWVHRGLDGIRNATLGDAVDFGVRFRRDRVAGEAWAREGTVGAALKRLPSSDAAIIWSAHWVATRETAFLDPEVWENGGTGELGAERTWNRSGSAIHRVTAVARGGFMYQPNRDAFSSNRYSFDPFARISVEALWSERVAGFTLHARGFGGAFLSPELPLAQSGIPVGGADPYATLNNPLVRAQGAPFVESDMSYHSPGGMNMRAYRAGLSGRWGVSANLEVHRAIFSRDDGLVRSAVLMGFWDAAVLDTVAVVSFSGYAVKPLHDAGGGVHVHLAIGEVTFPLRIEFPVYASSPFVARNRRQGDDFLEFRWLVSVQPIF